MEGAGRERCVSWENGMIKERTENTKKTRGTDRDSMEWRQQEGQ